MTTTIEQVRELAEAHSMRLTVLPTSYSIDFAVSDGEGDWQYESEMADTIDEALAIVHTLVGRRVAAEASHA